MLHTVDVPRNRWRALVEMIAERTTGQPIRVEVQALGIGNQELTALSALSDLELEEKGSDKGQLVITFGREDQEFTHRIPQPKHLYLSYDDSGAVQWMAIEDEDGGKTLIHFLHATQLETGFAAHLS